MRPKQHYSLNLQLFAEDEKEKNPNPEPKPESKSIEELTKALADMKQNFVPRSELEKVDAERRALTKAIIDGSTPPASNGEEKKPANLNELAKSCLEDGLSNYEMAKRQLAYRDASIEQLGKDPFLPNKSGVSAHDIERANAVAEAYRECINECEGNPALFDAMLASRISNDDPVAIAALKRKGRI